MSEIKAIEKLREWSHYYDNVWARSDGEVATIAHAEYVEPDMKNVGESWRKIADEIEREHAQRIAELNGAICERDGRIGSYERRNTELNDALKAICKRFGVSTEWSAEDAAKKVLEALDRNYMELPVDADGVPIHMGDSVEGEMLFDNATVRGTVSAFHLYNDEPDSVYIHVDVSGGGWTVKELRLTRCRHVKPHTLEDVLAEFADAAADVDERDREEWEPLLDRYADEIREMMGDGK